MELEQVNPNKPKFGLAVSLAGVAMLLILIAALVFLSQKGLLTRHPHRNPNALLGPVTAPLRARASRLEV